ncbi:ankyrin repeat domain-containing protein 50 [Denticeps clupeoides]|uniref:Ankyrin repeat domain-containing protein 50-like n=1 Tax=Denticeps clupeoides TaxID=299321 RepID=A0AAY4D2F0_9TELE|nr:ankyrin repeat domain-containing protein 50-like [Denticeps clupeoides]XP_028847702.1 ankyrin repeat domain-containing protein 50-like [Denticeps clupeoides]XP_028847703.1 ankyrin repeat domain-containing protein 50-like [Denticeps clupeoides]
MRGPSPSPLRSRRFHCREWALEKLRRCLDARRGARAPAGVLVTGGAGAGKTALCTEAVWPQSDGGRGTGLAARCLAWHFCQREDEGSVAAWRFVLNLAEQLRASPLLPADFRRALDRPEIAATLDPLHCQRDPVDTFKRAILEPLLDLPTPAWSVYVLVDSLDSGCGGVGDGVSVGAASMAAQSPSITELLAKHVNVLPSWILLVCSARRQNKAVCKMFSGFRRICLDDLRKPPVVRDVQQYILCRLNQESSLRRQLTPETADMLNLLHIKSGSCFLFLQRVLDGVSAGLVGLREIRDIPGTLNGLYLWLCQRLFPRKLFVHIRPLLNALLASPRPLTPQQLYTAVWTQDTGLSLGDFSTRLGALSTLLIEGPSGSKLLFHSSFAEWLTDVKYCTQKYLCNVREGHLMLAMALSSRAKSLSTEETCHLGHHLLSCGVHADNPALLGLWMLWNGVPSLDNYSKEKDSLDCGGDTRQSLFSMYNAPVLIHQDVLQLLMKSGVYPATCSPENGPSMGVNCVRGSGGIVRKALQREDSVRALLDSGVNVNWTEPSDGRTLLATAALKGSADIAALLLCHGANLLQSDHQGQTPLTLATRQGHVEVLHVLLDWAQDHHGTEAAVLRSMLEHADGEGWTALRSAAWGGHVDAVRLLLEAGAEVDGCDSEGRTALRAAAWAGHEEILLTLLGHGAQVNLADREGRTPLIAAAFMGHKEAVAILLDAGAEVDLADGDGRTALSVAALCVPNGGKGYGDVVSLLLESGANPAHRDHDGMTPLLLAAYEGQEEVLELLLEAGADVDECAGAQNSTITTVTPLLAAASMGHHSVVNRILFWGAAVDVIDSEGRTALCLAAARGSLDVVRSLLDRGLDENHKDDLGWTPLHAAACEGHRSVCAVLTEKGSMARVGEADAEGRTPLILAAQEGHCSTARLLLDRRSPIDKRGYDGHSALSAAALQRHREVVELLMRRGADTDVRDAEGRPLLYLLVLEGHLDMVSLLMEKGGVPLESRDAEGRTALHVAAWHGNAEAIKLLLGHGSDPNSQDSEGRSPLHSVGWRGHAVAGRMLLEARGVNVELACHQGATALSIAAQEGHTEIVSIFLEKGADPDHVDRYGRTPVKVAGKRGHFNIVRLLESYGAKPYPGLLLPPPPSRNPCPSQISNVKTQFFASSGSTGEVGVVGQSKPTESSTSSASPSVSCSPSSTADRFHSIPSSSSTCHSLATVQTVPADSLTFTQQIQQHSLPRCRSRPSTLPPSGSNAPSLYSSNQRSQVRTTAKVSPPPSSEPLVPNQPTNNLLESLDSNFTFKAQTHVIGEDLVKSPHQLVGGGKWNSVMASLGVTPGQDARPLTKRESPLLGYPPPNQKDTWDLLRKMPFSPTINLSVTSPSALADESMVSMTTTDPQLNLKQAIKLQFEGPTSAALYKRETPL